MEATVRLRPGRAPPRRSGHAVVGHEKANICHDAVPKASDSEDKNPNNVAGGLKA